MARSFDQVYAELGSAYDPSAQLVQKSIDAIPGSTEALVKQADAKKDLAFDQILGGMRRRGMGFSGITGEEQAKYLSTEYAPAIARMQGEAEGRKNSLLESLYGMNRDRRTQAQGMYDNELARDFQQQQFQEQIRQYNETLAEQRRQANLANKGGGSPADYLTPDNPTAPDAFASVDKQGATNSVLGMLKSGNQSRIASEIAAITRSAQYGNVFDKFKLELLKQYQTNSPYGNLIKNASKKVTVAPAKSGNVSVGYAKSGNVSIR